jgi:UDP-glucose 4-epimerase
MRAIVTGGAGFIGSHVVDALLAEGHEVVALDDLSSGKRENVPAKAHLEVVDIRNGDAVERVFAELRPEIVSHQAAQVSVSVSTREPVRDAQINILGSLNVLEAAAKHGVKRVVFASTGGAIYGEVPDGQRATLATVPLPLSPYACSKFAVEAYLRRYRHERGLESTILRYANVYGPRQDPHGEAGVVAIFTERLLAGQPVQVNARRVVGDGGCVRDYVYVEDVVRTNLRAMLGEIAAPVVNVASGVPTTTRELLEVIASASGAKAEVRQGDRRVGDVERSLLEPSLEAMGSITPLTEGIAKTVGWFRSRGH